MSNPNSHKSYRPFTIATFRWNFYLHGLHPNGYHIVNIALHAMVCSIFLFICHRLLRMSIQLAFLTAILFAVHPIHTEAVAGIVGRAEILSCLFFLLAFYTYAKGKPLVLSDEFAKTTSIKELLYCFIFTFVAMLSKEQGITVIAVCMAYDVAVASRKGFRRCLYHFDSHYLKLHGSSLMWRFGLVAVYLIALMSFRVWIMNGQLPNFSQHDNPAIFAKQRLTRVMTLSYLPAFNFWLLLYPRDLCYDWQMGSIPLIEKPTDIRNFYSLCFYLWLMHNLSGLASSFLKFQQVTLTIGFALLVIPFIPALNLFFPVGFVVAERVLYLPSMGFCIIVVLGLNQLSNWATRLSYKLKLTLGILVYAWLIIFSCRTVSRNNVWKTRESLFRSAIEVVPNNAKVYYNYANYLKDHHRLQEAATAYKTALRIAPDHASSSNNLATITLDEKESEELYQKAILHNPYHARAYFNYGNLLRRKGKLIKAVEMFKKAISIEDSFEGPWISLTASTGEMDRMDEASKLFEKMLRKFPRSADVYNNYGVHLTKLGRQHDAIKSYDMAISLNAAHHVAIVNKGRLLRKFGQNDQAEKHYRRALDIERSPETLYYLATLLLDHKRYKEAAVVLEDAIHQRPKRYDFNLAYVSF
ncbi:uncharacterized protein TRIADDRAFT_23574 [Trichoplax adhaerens]|uniref:dolichyl-phosphate-mannose--protein mannosyltransferase n=1 Tax=Trichoplax adhaerens TaxID=10228 RepID=B3RUD5_TRIAD|nr:hypothetical protein TRIADDRAFT_23574 [Trichoplax adhaerens]EDV25791.1 hypothetical protein TRIADDRAFT_23574 [Trichoplax adhaerens]|eukprot:XP_002111824.1 hypothetical protein TRIADDRAFT_23574 [Trichoplax adhaerens]